MKTSRNGFVFVLLLVAGGLALLYVYPPWSPTPREGSPAAPIERTVVTALGMLEPESRVINVGGPLGARLDHFADQITEGAVVSAGDPLVYLDSNAEMQAARDLAASELEQAQKQFRADTDFAQAAVAQAKLKIQQADDVLPLEIDAQRAEVRRSQVELEKTKLDLKRSKQLFDGKATAESQYDDAVLFARQCEEQLTRNRAALAQLEQDHVIQLGLARAVLQSAEAGLIRAQLSNRVESLTQALRLAESRLERTIIRSPIAGEILKILTRSGESLRNEPILMIGDTRSMFVTAEVYETDVRLVQPGQTARIRSLAFQETLSGRVEYVGRLVHKNDLLKIDPTADVDARVIEVRIRLDESTRAARYNHHQVDVEISVGKPDAPSQTIAREEP